MEITKTIATVTTEFGSNSSSDSQIVNLKHVKSATIRTASAESAPYKTGRAFLWLMCLYQGRYFFQCPDDLERIVLPLSLIGWCQPERGKFECIQALSGVRLAKDIHTDLTEGIG